MSQPLSPGDIKKQINKTLKERTGGPLPQKLNTRKAEEARNRRAAEWPNFDERRAQASERRQEILENLDEYHRRLKGIWAKRDIAVHEATDAASACRTVLEIVRSKGENRLIKAKTMLGEEIGLNDYLVDNGITPLETDLGEYIVQLRNETSSHITMPAMHLSRSDIGRLFAEKLSVPYTDDPQKLTRIARKELRKQFLTTRIGLVGVNFAVAETGHIATVTNEGNGRMATTLPDVVIALMGMERVTQSLADLALLWQLLARSATGQRATAYLNLLAGPSPGPTGPQEVHVVIVDNGRRKILEDSELREVLRCIRCGACLNSCPVYQQVGGHSYGGTYPGPIGKVITPALLGMEAAPDHAFTSTLCGVCEEVCPVKIPLPKLLLTLRQRAVEIRPAHSPELRVWRGFQKTMNNVKNYRLAAKIARLFQRFWPGGQIPIPGWTNHRDAPRFAAKSFRELFREQNARNSSEEIT